MEDHFLKKPLLAETVNVIQTTNGRGDPRKRRLRRCKSAPLAENFLGDWDVKNETLPPPSSHSIFGGIHSRIRRVIIYLFLYLAIGTICFYLVEDQIAGKKTNGFIDSVYFCIITMTSVGYGDLVPNSAATKLLACLFVFSGMALFCLVLSKGADYLADKQEMMLISALNMSRSQSEILNRFDKHRAKDKCVMVFILLVVHIVIGTIFLVTVEKLSLVNAFYCVCATITSLGYGDKSFSSIGGRIFAIFWILTSTVCVAQFFFCILELTAENKQKKIIKRVLAKRMTYGDLEAADLDDDGRVSAAEFVLYKLKETGKIKQDDISLAMKEFEILDFDQSGTLSLADLMLSQSSKTPR